MAGVCPAYVVVEEPCHEFADVKHCDPSALLSRPCGSARILWREGGTGGQWAVVRLSNCAEDMRRFRLVSSLERCGSATAERVIYDGSTEEVECPAPMRDELRWCEVDCEFTVYDSLGIVDSAQPGTFGWARWMPDSGKWEVVATGEGCCESSSSSSSDSSSSSGSSSSSIEEPSSSDSQSSSSGSSSDSSSGSCPGIPGVDLDALPVGTPEYILGIDQHGCLIKVPVGTCASTSGE